MRTALTRTALCALVAALAGCNYSRFQGAIEIDVTGIPQSAVRAELVVTDSTGVVTKREPSFGAGVYVDTPLILTLPPIAPGAYSLQLTAYDVDDTPLACVGGAPCTASQTASYTPATGPDEPLPVVDVALSASGLQGTYGTPCILTGTGINTCSGDLVCKQYTASDQGICTHSCNGSATCEQTPPGATCEAFLGVAANQFCQYECEADGGGCPAGLTCGAAQSASGGKRFCQGSL